MERRWGVHLKDLRRNQHPNLFMQAVFNKYGQRFEPEVISYIHDPKTLAETEQEWLNQHFGHPGCVNASNSALYNPNFEKTCLTLSELAKIRFGNPIQRAKTSERQKGVPKSEESKAKMSMVWKDTHVWSDELKAKWSEQRKGKKRSPEYAAKTSARMKGHITSPETREKISQSNKKTAAMKKETKQKK